jgi:acid phosphatase family membrane protein YuiD
VIFVYIFQNKVSYERFIGSGGMPSSHSAFIVSLAVTIGKNEGWDSMLFGMAVAVSLIVMYDAAGVRRAAGKQAEVLNKLILSLNDRQINFNEKLKELLGHSPLEVIAGAFLGIVIGLLIG